MMSSMQRWLMCLAYSMVVVLTGCGGTSDSGGTGGTGITTGVYSGVVTGYGSVVVNNIHFDETSANVNVNDVAGTGDHRGIKLGMTVKIRAAVSGTTGVATDIEAEHAVEGKVTATNGTDTLTVLGQTVVADGQTRYEPAGIAFSHLSAGTRIEVYGLLDQNNIVRATLIELVDIAEFEEEIRGTITNLNTTIQTFEINGYVIHYDGTTLYSDGGSMAALVNGLTVEVHFNTDVSGNHATEIEFEDIEDAVFQLEDDGRFEIEAYVTGIIDASHFIMAGQVIQTTATTSYENGAASDLAVGRKVHATGRLSGGVKVANRIEFY